MFNLPHQFSGALPLGLFATNEVPFGLATLQADPNCVLIQDPSQVWGVQDFLPMRNLLTYSGDYTNAVWTKRGTCSVTAGRSDPWGTTRATKLDGVGTGGVDDIYYKLGTATSSGVLAGFWFNKISTSGTLRVTNGNGGSNGTWLIDLSVIPSGWVFVTNTTAGVTVSIPFTYALNGGYGPLFSCTAGAPISFYLSGIMACSSDTIDQSYQAVTDWTTEQYAWAAQKSVPWLRRNMCTKTDDMLSATYWTKSNVSASGQTITASAGLSVHLLGQATAYKLNTVSGQTYTMQCKAKKGTHNYVQFVFASSGFSNNCYQNYDLDLGQLGSGGADVFGSSISGPDSEGFYEISTSANSNAAGAGAFFQVTIVNSATSARAEGFSATGTESIEIKQQTFSVGVNASYQPIGESWDATYTANAIAAGYPISLWQDSAGTTAVNGDNQPIGKMLNYKLNGLYDATQATTANQPKWRLDANGKALIQRDTVNDALPITLPNLGSNCSVYIGEGSTVTELTAQTLNGSYAPITPAKDYGRVIFQTPTSKSAKVIKWLLAKAGY